MKLSGRPRDPLTGDPADQGPHDHVGRIVAQWAMTYHQLPLWPIAALAHVKHFAFRLEEEMASILKPLGLQIREYELLGALRRAGEPYRLAPKELTAALLVSAGTITNRLDELEDRELVRRERNLGDRRALWVSLTSAGLEMTDKAASVLNAAMAELFEPIGPEGSNELVASIRAVLLPLERGQRDQR